MLWWVLEEFEGPLGHYTLEKGLLHVNYVLKHFLVEKNLKIHMKVGGRPYQSLEILMMPM